MKNIKYYAAGLLTGGLITGSYMHSGDLFGNVNMHIREAYSHWRIKLLQYDNLHPQEAHEGLLGCVVSGNDFNKIFNQPRKYINGNYTHYGMKYDHIGKYTDVLPFFPYKECEPGGLYFATGHTAKYCRTGYKYVAELSIPNDAHVYVEHNKFKTDKFVIKRIDVNRPPIHIDCYD